MAFWTLRIYSHWEGERTVNLYLLYNGVNVRIMAIEGSRVTPEEFIRASAKLRTFFNLGTREVILVNIRPEAVESIVKAIVAFDAPPVPLATAIAQLLNFCRDAERAYFSGAQATLPEVRRG
jgi:hypothetical protein